MQRVEFATLNLARRCGLNVTQARLETVGASDVLMLERFDRQYEETRTDKGYLRFGLVSGLTVLDCGDSHLDRARWSYPLADNLRRWSDKPEADCAELFRRMVFNAAVTNNDDHPRNRPLLRRHKGWRLSPAYDLVPAPVVSQERRDLALTVGRLGRTASMLTTSCRRRGVSACRSARRHAIRLTGLSRSSGIGVTASWLAPSQQGTLSTSRPPSCRNVSFMKIGPTHDLVTRFTTVKVLSGPCTPS